MKNYVVVLFFFSIFKLETGCKVRLGTVCLQGPSRNLETRDRGLLFTAFGRVFHETAGTAAALNLLALYHVFKGSWK